jgi:SAM-dependent methyltransferase
MTGDTAAPGHQPARIGRSVRLFRDFLAEQSDPDRFYRALAADSVHQLSGYVALPGGTVLDVGGGPGYFAEAFRAAGARYVGVDPDVGELSGRGGPAPGMLRASGTALPVRDAAVDVCYSSNVLEHVPEPVALLAEMARVTKPGGTVFVSFTPWWSPWGGHETAPWHYLGGGRARARYLRRHGREPKNRYGETLFGHSVAAALGWLRAQPSCVPVAVFPRYHPWWAQWVIRVPVLREVASWNVAAVLRRR